MEEKIKWEKATYVRACVCVRVLAYLCLCLLVYVSIYFSDTHGNSAEPDKCCFTEIKPRTN